MESIGVFDELTNQLRAIEFDDDDDDYQDALADEEQAETTSTTLSKKLQDRRKKAKNRRRRRSSAQFLNLGEEDDDDQQPLSSANLGEVYQNAIRMNAENKINAANSWNLNLIDHLDQFVSSSSSKKKGDAGVNSIQEGIQQLSLESDDIGVNFTKASCTLDASVKIYSYRVDDVHLTSYKVLANLNRTETGKNSKKDDNAANTKDAGSEGTTKTAATQNRKVSETETLEQNLANINISKLDEAFDIDPLFHKMSKTFDEGGAKGLLLANLGVSNKGCNIVFDSTLEEQDEPDVSENPDNATENNDVDVTLLTQKLEASLDGQPIFLMQLVPQLASLREEYSQLKEGGFVDKLIHSSLRYAASSEDEIEADKSIHLEAIERSRASQAGRSLLAKDQDGDSVSYVDFGAGNDFGGDDDDNNFLEDSMFHDGNHRYSSSSFQASFEATQEPSQAVVLLDAIANGDILGSQSNYEYFNSQALSQIQGNMGAGAAHWKKQTKKSTKATRKKKTTKGKGKKAAASKSKKKIKLKDIIDLQSPVEDLLRPKHVAFTEDHASDNASFCGNSDAGPGFDFGGDDDDHGDEEDFIVPELDGVRKIEKIQVGYATVAKKVDVKRLKNDLWEELERSFAEKKQVSADSAEEKEEAKSDEDYEEPNDEPVEMKQSEGVLSFQSTVREMQSTQTQADATLPFFFICILHLANEKGLALESTGLEDFIIHSS